MNLLIDNLIKRVTVLTFFTFITISIYSQEVTFFMNDKSYLATNEYIVGTDCVDLGNWTLTSKNSNVKLFFARNNEEGLVIFKHTDKKLLGTIIFYLENQSIVKLIDQEIWDYVDETHIRVYPLTSSEVEKLKNSNIQTIRYNVESKYGQKESKTTNNKHHSCYDTSFKMTFDKPKHDFPSIINNLYNY